MWCDKITLFGAPIKLSFDIYPLGPIKFYKRYGIARKSMTALSDGVDSRVFFFFIYNYGLVLLVNSQYGKNGVIKSLSSYLSISIL